MSLAQRLGLYTIDVGRVAGPIAADLLRDYAPQELSYQSTVQYARTRYMRLVAAHGLPPAAALAVGEAVWRVIKAAGGVSQERETFAFYE